MYATPLYCTYDLLASTVKLVIASLATIATRTCILLLVLCSQTMGTPLCQATMNYINFVKKHCSLLKAKYVSIHLLL